MISHISSSEELQTISNDTVIIIIQAKSTPRIAPLIDGLSQQKHIYIYIQLSYSLWMPGAAETPEVCGASRIKETVLSYSK